MAKRILLVDDNAAVRSALRRLFHSHPDFEVSGARIPATVSAIADAVRWAERIMEEIDRRHPAKPTQEKRVT